MATSMSSQVKNKIDMFTGGGEKNQILEAVEILVFLRDVLIIKKIIFARRQLVV